MAWYEYEGMTPGGTAIVGQIEAVDPDRARADLEQMQVQVRSIAVGGTKPPRTAGISENDFIFFNEQLASLAQAGIALDEGLAQLARDVESPRLKRWIDDVVQDLRRGVPIDESVKAREAGLPLLYSQVLRAGIQSGELPATLLNLSQHLRILGNTRRMLWELASYPILVTILAFTIMSFFYLLVVPRFAEIYKDFGTQLPMITRLAMATGDNYLVILAVLLLVVAGIVLGWRLLRLSRGGMALRESLIFMFPVIGRIHRASLVARFLRAVSTSLATGIPLPDAMRLGAGATGSPALISDAERVASEVESGQSIFVATQVTRIIPALFGFCVQVAVGRDALPVAIAQLANSYENRAMHTQALLRVFLLPAVIIFIGGFISFAVVAMFMPLVSLINAVSSGG